MEVTTALRSEDPTQFVSYFPTHQDGSCNGLQHYAALGRDQAGAESVNLSPFTHPQDVYSDVVELVSFLLCLLQQSIFIPLPLSFSLKDDYRTACMLMCLSFCFRWRKYDRRMLRKD